MTKSWLHYPQRPKAPEAAPDILLVLTDDVGFGACSTFGGLIPTPSLDRTQGEIREQSTHVVDIAPTILEVLGLELPATIDRVTQQPIEGTSFAYTFADASAPSRHDEQYFEMLGNRGLYQRGWMASTLPPRPPFPFQDLRGKGRVKTTPVDAFPANGFGIFVMIGNVWEWTSDPYRYTADRSASCCEAPASKVQPRVIKGGSFLCAENACRRYRPAARHRQDANTSTNHLGFRCIPRSTPTLSSSAV